MRAMGKLVSGLLTLAVLMFFVLPLVALVLVFAARSASVPTPVGLAPHAATGPVLPMILSIAGLAVLGLLLVLLVGLVIAVLRWVFGGRRQQRESGDETRIIQEIYRGLAQMEKRIESLETVLLGREHETSTDAERWRE